MIGSSVVESMLICDGEDGDEGSNNRNGSSTFAGPAAAPAAALRTSASDGTSCTSTKASGGPNGGSRIRVRGRYCSGNGKNVPPSLLESAAGGVEDVAGSSTSTGTSAVVTLLHGPPRSGKTSLLMDLAIHLAAKAPCRCDDFCDEGDGDGESLCRCTGVVVFRVAANSGGTDRFPLFCRQVRTAEENRGPRIRNATNNDNNKSENGGGSIEQVRGRGTAIATTRSAAKSSTDGTEDRLKWLHRVQIHHVSHIGDLYTALLSLQGWPVEKQPWGGILVDDWDRLVSSCRGGGGGIKSDEAPATTTTSPAGAGGFSSPPASTTTFGGFFCKAILRVPTSSSMMPAASMLFCR